MILGSNMDVAGTGKFSHLLTNPAGSWWPALNANVNHLPLNHHQLSLPVVCLSVVKNVKVINCLYLAYQGAKWGLWGGSPVHPSLKKWHSTISISDSAVCIFSFIHQSHRTGISWHSNKAWWFTFAFSQGQWIDILSLKKGNKKLMLNAELKT